MGRFGEWRAGRRREAGNRASIKFGSGLVDMGVAPPVPGSSIMPQDAETPAPGRAAGTQGGNPSKGMYLDPRQTPASLAEPAMDAGQAPEQPSSLTVTISGPEQQAHAMLAYIRERYGEQALS